MAYMSSGLDISNNTATKIQFDTEVFDTDNCFDNSTNYRFTPTESGQYFFFASTRFNVSTDFESAELIVKKNGSNYFDIVWRSEYYDTMHIVGIADLNGSTDYLEVFANQSSGGTLELSGSNATRHLTKFGAYKLIGV